MMARRTCLAILLYSDSRTTQLLIYRVMLICMNMYVGYYRPSVDKHAFDLLNECFLMIQAVLIPVFTEFVADKRMRSNVGWVSAGFLSA